VARTLEIGFVAAISVAETVEMLLPPGFLVALKWPNDVLVNGAKIAGILLECEPSDHTVPWVVLGIGINISVAPSDLPYSVTALSSSRVGSIMPQEVLPILLEALRRWLTIWDTLGFSPVRHAWLRRARRLGPLIQVRIGEDLISGRAVDLDCTGALIIETPERRRHIIAGEVMVHGECSGCTAAATVTCLTQSGSATRCSLSDDPDRPPFPRAART
jgi:BirA family biotin operon repressor/biotin-[acetyl-CoA-carboxylase] ligase